MTEPEPKPKPKHASANKRSTAQKELDLLFIEREVVRGRPMRKIAALLSEARPYTISHVQVHSDIKKLEKLWRKESIEEITRAKRHQLRKLDELEAELWDAWDRSKKDELQKTMQRTGTGESDDSPASRESNSVKKVSRDGNGMFTRQLLELFDRRAKLLGLDAPERKEISGVDGKPIQVESDEVSVNIHAEMELTAEESRELMKRHYERTFGAPAKS